MTLIYAISFGECVTAEFSLRPASEPRRINEICTTSLNYAEIVIRDPFGPMNTKGLLKIATRIRFGIETSNDN